jgi:hypothetical protein
MFFSLLHLTATDLIHPGRGRDLLVEAEERDRRGHGRTREGPRQQREKERKERERGENSKSGQTDFSLLSILSLNRWLANIRADKKKKQKWDMEQKIRSDADEKGHLR